MRGLVLYSAFLGVVLAVKTPNTTELSWKRNEKIAALQKKQPGKVSWSDWFGSLFSGRDTAPTKTCDADILVLHEASRQAAVYKEAIEESLAKALEKALNNHAIEAKFFLSTFQDKHSRSDTRHCYHERVRNVRTATPIGDAISYMPHQADLKNYTANSLEAIANAIQRSSIRNDNWGNNTAHQKLILITAASAPKMPKDLDGRLRRRHRRWPKDLSNYNMDKLCAKYDYPPPRYIAPLVLASDTYIAFLILPGLQQEEVYEAYLKFASLLYEAPESVQKLPNAGDQKAWDKIVENIINVYTAQVCL
eukprot:Gregarina_sp_Poly_1__2593@NODE_1702_length_3512_cov_284_243251_g1115_i0_p1_GENE_NODE_1702_length_3512_cov_284_243251_g1115_i0NODE_1702_length_3512_cov_284_243251_g1115_i0_p1_ORF_typecomplete_len307_score40_14Integrin_beta/PF00362_18/0_0051_NODE_1702_length_3512_cov_284_243251_g1115_i020642984